MKDFGMCNEFATAMEAANFNIDASIKAMQELRERLGIPPEKPDPLRELVGNVTVASTPELAETLQQSLGIPVTHCPYLAPNTLATTDPFLGAAIQAAREKQNP